MLTLPCSLSRCVWFSFLNNATILFIYSLVLLSYVYISYTKVIPLDGDNFDTIINGAPFAIVNFYAEWCPHSRTLKPIFEEASNVFENETKVVFASVDSDKKPGLVSRFKVNKFPTLKYFYYGEIAKKEYRQSRSLDALTTFVQSNLKPVFRPLTNREEIETTVYKSRRNIFAYLFSAENSVELFNLEKIAFSLRDDCHFYLAVGPAFKEELQNGNNVVFRPPQGTKSDEISLSGAMLLDYEYLKHWITDKCIPLVRELLFSNAEELTEEGLPFLILFRDPDDDAILKKFTDQVAKQLHDQLAYINVLHADGIKFAHPLHHMGKSMSDLPLIAIDSFTHMYVFPDINKLDEPNSLKQFVADLYTGKLHREFHHGPDPTLASVTHYPGQIDVNQNIKKMQTDPPSSIFKKLKPSDKRYSMKDEL